MRDDVAASVVLSSHRVETRVESWLGEEYLGEVVVDDGAITYTYGAKIPGRLELTVPYNYNPTSRHSPLAALGQRLNVTRIMYNEAGAHALNLGWFLVQGWEMASPVIDVEAVSLEQVVADYRFDQAYQPASGSTYLDILEEVIGGLLPVEWDGTPASKTITTDAYLWEESRIDCMYDVAGDWGADVRVDADGVLSLSAERQVQATPHRSFRHGEVDAYVRWSTTAMRDQVYNSVVARGEKSDGTPIQAIAVDSNPNSRTYYYGPYGRRQRFYESQFITSQSQAKAVAQRLLAKELLRDTVVQIEAPPDPRLELGDTIEVVTEQEGVMRGLLIEYSLPLVPSGGVAKYKISAETAE